MTDDSPVPTPETTTRLPGWAAAWLGLLSVALVGLGLALFLVSSHAADQRAGLEQRIAKLEQPAAVDNELPKLKARLVKIEECIPELMTYANSMELDRQTLYISADSQISRQCQRTLWGATGE